MNNNKFRPLKISHIPTEIFILICEELPPSSLFALSKTCLKYYEYLVSSQIWKTSRERSVPYNTITKFEKKNLKMYMQKLFNYLKVFFLQKVWKVSTCWSWCSNLFFIWWWSEKSPKIHKSWSLNYSYAMSKSYINPLSLEKISERKESTLTSCSQTYCLFSWIIQFRVWWEILFS